MREEVAGEEKIKEGKGKFDRNVRGPGFVNSILLVESNAFPKAELTTDSSSAPKSRAIRHSTSNRKKETRNWTHRRTTEIQLQGNREPVNFVITNLA